MNKAILLLVAMLCVSSVAADYLSINSGGDNQIIINPEEHIEGIFGPEITSVSVQTTGGTALLPTNALVREDRQALFVIGIILGCAILAAIIIIIVASKRDRNA